ncbi:MAG: DUF3006 domain-containing protein [Eubacteriales bacterium]|nr:DUF3006 domain-containing protein [Eubacteriales bacterium]
MTRLEGFIDHFDQDFAVISRVDRSIANISRRELPIGAQVGDFIVEANSACHFLIDHAITELRRREMRYLFDALYD